MKKYFFSAYGLTNELDLNLIARSFGINKKYKWEDPLILSGEQLGDFCKHTEDKSVYIYFFGSAVFINFSAAEMTTFIKHLETNFNKSKNPFTLNYVDEYDLEIKPDSKLKITNDCTSAPSDNQGYVDIISLVVARSVAFERIEDGINKVIDEVEDIVTLLDQGVLNFKDEKLAKLSSRILRFKFASISYIMILEKPDITWESIEIDEFYYELIELFEIEDRYEQIQHKLETLMDTTEVFSNLAHEKRSTRLEWMVIILILFEIILYIFDMIFK